MIVEEAILIKIADAVAELAQKHGHYSECQIGEMTLPDYGSNTRCMLVMTQLKDFGDQQDIAVYGAEIIKIFNEYLPELQNDPIVIEVYPNQGVFFAGRALVPLQEALQKNQNF